MKVAAIPLHWLTVILTPAVWCLEMITKPFLVGRSAFLTSEAEIAMLSDIGATEGVIEHGEAELIRRIFTLNDVTASDMMTPRDFVEFLNGQSTILDEKEFLESTSHSRFPVYLTHENHILGIVYQRDLLIALAHGKGKDRISNYVTPTHLINEDRLADDLLRDFQQQRSHLGIVANAQGTVVGVVSLEDVLEELVGEIVDERDITPSLMKRISRHEILVHGDTQMDAINRFLHVQLPVEKTVNQFLLDTLGEGLEKDQVHTAHGVTFVIDKLTSHEIERVRIRK
jgi:CBS domain containing-hemolysin-like protein